LVVDDVSTSSASMEALLTLCIGLGTGSLACAILETCAVPDSSDNAGLAALEEVPVSILSSERARLPSALSAGASVLSPLLMVFVQVS